MASLSIVKIKVRRGLELERRQVILDVGELGFTTDSNSKRLFVGDGSTQGGISIASKVFYKADLSDISTYNFAQNGDILYDKTTKQLLVLDGLDETFNYNTASLNYIGPGVDNSSIGFSSAFPGTSGILTVKNEGINENKLADSTFSNGISGGKGVKVQVVYDNVKLTIVSNKLTVNEGGLDLSLVDGSTLPTSLPGTPDKLWNDGGTVKVS